MRIDIKGDILSDEDALFIKIYEWYNMPFVTPGKVSKALTEGMKNAKDGEPIDVYINSRGGSVFAGAEIYEMLRQHIVTVHITGLAASAASVVACAGARTLISPAGAMMIHNAISDAEGDYRDMEQMAQMLRQVNRTISSAYMEKTGKGEKELLKLMDSETWMNAADCVANGFCDAVEPRPEKKPVRLAASMGLSLTEEQIERAKAAIAKEDAEKKASAEGSGEDLRRSKAKALLCLMRLREKPERTGSA